MMKPPRGALHLKFWAGWLFALVGLMAFCAIAAFYNDVDLTSERFLGFILQTVPMYWAIGALVSYVIFVKTGGK